MYGIRAHMRRDKHYRADCARNQYRDMNNSMEVANTNRGSYSEGSEVEWSVSQSLVMTDVPAQWLVEVGILGHNIVL